MQRYFDPNRRIMIVKVDPGEFYISNQEEAITTVLGSCISACIRDPELGIGGMNHFMLPIQNTNDNFNQLISEASRYGNWAMEYLINGILKIGGRRGHLEVKIFGGGNVIRKMSSNIGGENVNFILNYLSAENLKVQAQDIGGNVARNIIYFPKTGIVKVKHLLLEYEKEGLEQTEISYFKQINEKPKASDIELF